MLTGNGRTITWTSFNMPASITEGANTVTFQYDGEHNRVAQVTPAGTILYFRGAGEIAELTYTSTTQDWRSYIAFGGQQTGMVWDHYTVSGGTVTLASSTPRYFLPDQLGSETVLLDQNEMANTPGSEHYGYDAWGKRRYFIGADDPTNAIISQTTRGFTGQEHLADTPSLIHLNGRVYDPQIGRMLSADPGVQSAETPYDPQAWNSYSYAGNNPTSVTDPSGYGWFDDLGGLIDNIGKFH